MELTIWILGALAVAALPMLALGRVGDLVEAGSIGKLALRGINRPIAAYNVLRLRD